MKPLAPHRVALLVPKFAWALRSGIARFSGPPMLWDTITYERNDDGFAQARHWKPHGLIGMLGRADLMKRAKVLRAPFVNVHGGVYFEGAAQIGCDHRAIGRTAAEHLSSLGFSHFACIGFPMEDPNLDHRLGGYIAALDHQPVLTYDPRTSYPPCPKIRGTFIEADDGILHRWIWSLPKPCAVFASGDMLAARVLRACLHLEVPVPEQIAIVGVGDMPEFCLDLPIALSSVSVPWDQIGFEAGALLNRMMAGGKPPKSPILLAPLGVTVRRSSDVYAVADPRVADALRFIRAHACERISVPDILKKVPMGRRVLERKFRTLLNRSPHDEILRVRLEKTSKMLIHTNATLESIAEDAGFSTVARLSVEFKKRFELSPGAYRKQFKK
jgi:LacI family transcriptional regulator